jgi:hypothetical protein
MGLVINIRFTAKGCMDTMIYLFSRICLISHIGPCKFHFILLNVSIKLQPFQENIIEQYFVKKLKGSRVLNDLRSKGCSVSSSAGVNFQWEKWVNFRWEFSNTASLFF